MKHPCESIVRQRRHKSPRRALMYQWPPHIELRRLPLVPLHGSHASLPEEPCKGEQNIRSWRIDRREEGRSGAFVAECFQSSKTFPHHADGNAGPFANIGGSYSSYHNYNYSESKTSCEDCLSEEFSVFWGFRRLYTGSI